MTKNKVVRHVIPQVGMKEITLYPPSDEVYDRLLAKKEVTRLNELRHLGALYYACPGARQTRWDYTLAMLYYSSMLRIPGMNSIFRIGRTEFSSAIATLQCISLLWNIGHLPGTFSVEKGVYRYLHSNNPERPSIGLQWPTSGDELIDKFKSGADTLLLSEDYTALSRVLAVIKILDLSPGRGDILHCILEDIIGPFFLNITASHSEQWPKLRQAFTLVRHLAYLTLDSSYTGLQWSPNVPALFNQTLESDSKELQRIASRISETLSPIERFTYELIYHSPDARRECALVSEQVCQHLLRIQNPPMEIHRWMRCGLFDELRLEKNQDLCKLKRVADIRLRSHFAIPSDSPVEIEQDLRARGFTHPAVFIYKAWNSDILLEPDELIIDAITEGDYSINDIGKLILWIVGNIDNLNSLPNELFSMLRKNDVEGQYRSLFSRAIEKKFEGIFVQLKPWRLKDFGLFWGVEIAETSGAIWAANARLDDPITQHILRDRSKHIPLNLHDQYIELMGLRELRIWLRRKEAERTESRQRFLIVTGSVQFWNESRSLIEFDGGLLRISTRSGRMIWYGLESKRRSSNPLRSLNRRIRALEIVGKTHSLSNHYAVLEITL